MQGGGGTGDAHGATDPTVVDDSASEAEGADGGGDSEGADGVAMAASGDPGAGAGSDSAATDGAAPSNGDLKPNGTDTPDSGIAVPDHAPAAEDTSATDIVKEAEDQATIDVATSAEAGATIVKPTTDDDESTTAPAAAADATADGATAMQVTTAVSTTSEPRASGKAHKQKHTISTRVSQKTGVGRSPVGPVAITLLTLYFIAISLLLFHTLLAYWPIVTTDAAAAASPGASPAPSPSPGTGSFFGAPTQWLGMPLDREQRLLLLVALASALGAMAHVLRSFFRYAGERQLRWSWVPSYFLIPLVGILMATFTYILIRGGLISGGSDTALNPFGFAAVGALVGLFSAQAAEKLKQVFETLFTKPDSGGDSLDIGKTKELQVEPTTGKPLTVVQLSGPDMSAVYEVTFAKDVAATNVTWDPDLAVLMVTVPEGAVTGPIEVTISGVTYQTAAEFEVAPAT
ncbi:MAG: hypothetical protein QOH61_2389 [Chloroflexota bacterium]|jgi:hypothetical protein|nr:hypothetical protein [Chloroflexota bacterium]